MAVFRYTKTVDSGHFLESASETSVAQIKTKLKISPVILK